MAIGLGALVVFAVWTDLKSRRIPNVLTVAGCGVALLLRASQGWEPLGEGLLGLFLGLAISLPLVIAGGLGGGDAKLLAAVGAFLGPVPLLIALLITALVGGVMAAALAIYRGALYETLIRSGELLKSVAGFRGAGPRRRIDSAGALMIPYAVPIAIGALVGWFL